MKNKTLFISIGVIVATLIVALIIQGLSGNLRGFKADITYPTTNAIAFSCDKTSILVDERATCVLVGHYTGGIDGIDGIFNVNNNLTIESIVKNSSIFTGEMDNSYFTDETSPANFEIATVTVKGTTVGAGRLAYVGVDDGDETTVDKVIVTYNDGEDDASLDDATINITVTDSQGGGDDPEPPLSSVCTLNSLTVSSGQLSPSFSKNVYNYMLTVDNEVDSITINGTKTDANSSVDGFDSYELTVGENEIEITVTAQDSTKNTYNITVTRQPAIDNTKSSDNTLSELKIKNVTLKEDFSSTKTEYTAEVENNITSVDVQATVNDERANVVITGNHDLIEGNNTILVKVTAENGSVKTYTIIVNRKKSSNEPCVLELKSTIYKVDNTKLTLELVNNEHTLDMIKSNVSSSCGTINVTDDKIVLQSGNEVKTYTINRVFVPKTGQNVVNYILVILGIGLVIGVLVYLKKKTK